MATAWWSHWHFRQYHGYRALHTFSFHLGTCCMSKYTNLIRNKWQKITKAGKPGLGDAGLSEKKKWLFDRHHICNLLRTGPPVVSGNTNKTLRMRQEDSPFSRRHFQMHFLEENCHFSTLISLISFSCFDRHINDTWFVPIMVRHCRGNKVLS